MAQIASLLVVATVFFYWLMDSNQGSLQKFWFGVEGGVAVSRTVPSSKPSIYILICGFQVQHSILFDANLEECYLHVLSQHPNSIHSPPPSLLFFSCYSSFGGEAGWFGRKLPPCPPIDKTPLISTFYSQREGAKLPMQELKLKVQGGVIAGFYVLPTS